MNIGWMQGRREAILLELPEFNEIPDLFTLRALRIMRGVQTPGAMAPGSYWTSMA